MMSDIDAKWDGSGGLCVSFAETGGSRDCRGEGWSGQEADSVWTIGARSTVRLPAMGVGWAGDGWAGEGWPADRPAILELDVDPVLAPPLVRAQILTVWLGGQVLGWQRITRPSRVCCRIAPELLDTRAPLDLTFDHPGFVRFDQLDMGGDARTLAFRFFGLRLGAEATTTPAGETTSLRAGIELLDLVALVPAPPAEATAGDLAAGQPGQAHLQAMHLHEGWHTDAEGLVWTAARTSRLILPDPGHPGPVSLRIELAPLLVKDLLPAQRLAVIADGVMLGQFQVRCETALSVALPMRSPATGQGIELTFHTPDAMPMRLFAHARPQHSLGFVLDGVAAAAVPPRLCHATALRGDGIEPALPLAVSQRFLDLPADALPAAIEAELGITAVALMRGFESLGDNCGFGLAQRKAGAEVLGLLRFANTPLRSLLRGLADGFAAATDAAEIDLYLHPDGNPREYMLRIARYGIRWHTMVHEPDADSDSVARDQILKLGFLRRKFANGLRSGRKIYTLLRAEPHKVTVVMPGYDAPQVASASHGPTQLLPAWDPPQHYELAPAPLCLAEAQAVLLELNRFGPNTLLYFVAATAERPAGTVELLAPGLMRASMASFVILTTGQHANDLDWLRVAANAWLLDKHADAPGRHKDTA